MTEKKTYEEMTQEERDERNRAAFVWELSDLIFCPAYPVPPEPTDEELDEWYENMAKETDAYLAAQGYRDGDGNPRSAESFESNSLLDEEHRARLVEQHGEPEDELESWKKH